MTVKLNELQPVGEVASNSPKPRHVYHSVRVCQAEYYDRQYQRPWKDQENANGMLIAIKSKGDFSYKSINANEVKVKITAKLFFLCFSGYLCRTKKSIVLQISSLIIKPEVKAG